MVYWMGARMVCYVADVLLCEYSKFYTEIVLKSRLGRYCPSVYMIIILASVALERIPRYDKIQRQQ